MQEDTERLAAFEPVVVNKDKTLAVRLYAHLALVFRGVRFATTWHACWMVLVTCLCTFLCSKGVLGIKFNTSMTILAAGTIFPLVFSVQAGFSRRDEALSALAKLKGAMFTVWLMFKTWEKGEDGTWIWEKDAPGRWAVEVEMVFAKLLDDIELYLRGDRPAREESGNVVYDGLATLCHLMAKFAPHSGHTQYGGQGGIGRMSCFHRDIVLSFERVRVVLDTQMPVGLRLFCFALIHVSPIVLAPYWNHFCYEKIAHFDTYDMSESTYGCPAGYFIATTYVLILVTLYRVQIQLENPLHGGDDDDVDWEQVRASFDQLATYGKHGDARRETLAARQMEQSGPSR